MAEKFEFDKAKYADSADKIKLSDTHKNILISKMQNAQPYRTEIQSVKRKTYKMWTKTVAAVLAITIIGSAAYFLGDSGNKENSFILTASATEIGTSEIKIASGEMVTNFAMQVFSGESADPYLNEYGKKDLFQKFLITELTVKGQNVKSITFDTSKNSTYFNLNTDNYNNEFADIQPLTHSQYSTDEFEKYYDGFFGYVCDGFTYRNIDESEEISLDNKISLMIESDYADSQISDWMNVVSDCSDKREMYQALYAPEDKVNGSRFATDEEIANDEKMEEYTDMIVEKTLDGATIVITVKFTDGTEQSKTLLLGYDNIGEESFLTAKTT